MGRCTVLFAQGADRNMDGMSGRLSPNWDGEAWVASGIVCSVRQETRFDVIATLKAKGVKEEFLRLPERRAQSRPVYGPAPT